MAASIAHKSGAIELRERSALAKQLRLDVAQLTDVGRKREHNEDNMAYVIPKDPQVMAMKGALFIVADGMGGHAAGEVASEIAVDTVSNAYYQDDGDDVAASLLQSIRRANAAIHQRAAENMLRSGMGTTCVAAVLRGSVAYIANVGDSRAYLVRNGQVKQISQDHSWVYEQVRAGLLTEDQARTHAQRNVITRSLGTQVEVDIDVFHEPLQEGDTLILCSDGLSGLVSDEELQRIVDQFVPQESVYHLVERANANGGPDNITAIVVRVQEMGVEPPGLRHPVQVGGREMGDSAIIAQSPTLPPGTLMTYPSRNGEMPLVGSPLQIISGPLSSPDSITAPQPTLERSQARRNRLFYPALALLVLIILALVGGGVYYFTRSDNVQVVSSSLSHAQQLVTRAENELNRNPSQALTDLATAQKSLQNVKSKYQLDAGQSQKFSKVQSDLVSTTKNAIVQYNKAANITLLSCVNPGSHAINNTSTHTQVQSIFPVVNTKGAVMWYAYTSGQGGGVYLLNPQNSLVSSLANTDANSTLSISSNGSYLIALTERVIKNQSLSYSISTYQPDQSGKLNAAPPVQISSGAITNSLTPTFITSWKSNVYVVLTSSSQGNQNNVRVLSYMLDAKGHLGTPKSFDFSVSYPPIVSAAAFLDQNLFLLESNGSILNFVVPTDPRHQSVPGSVEVDSSVAAPLSVSPQDFKEGETVPVASTSVLPGNGPLMVTGISPTSLATLSAGQVNNVTHLYVGDSYNHRVLDLVVNPTVIAGGPTPVPTASSTPASNGQSVNFHLVNQFVSSNNFTQVKSIALQPNSSHLNVLAQNSSGQNLVSFDTAAQSNCPS
ncbi:MAG TPA: Stp1/IreP family PP2C-type Ser/Thr phosphatase [Ktedonobacteraceae bacterium]